MWLSENFRYNLAHAHPEPNRSPARAGPSKGAETWSLRRRLAQYHTQRLGRSANQSCVGLP